MGYITDKSADVYRDYVTTGVPASGENKPRKPDIRSLFASLDASLAMLLAAFVGDQAVSVYSFLSELQADLSPASGSLGIVYNDGVKNGLYVKVGPSGSGSWSPTGLMLQGQRGERGPIGPDGKSFYQVAIDTGYVPIGTTEQAFIATVVGNVAGVATAEAAGYAAEAKAHLLNFPDYYQGSPGGDAAQIGLFEAAKNMSFAAGINRIQTTGRAARGDGGAAAYTRWIIGSTALPAEGQDIWWFEAADGSRWQIEAAPMHMAAMFGALGGDQINAAPLLKAAFNAPQVRTINLGSLTHYIGGPSSQQVLVNVPNGKNLVGVNREVSWLKVIPLASGDTQAAPRRAVQFLNSKSGFALNFSLDCQRSGEGRDDNQRTHGLCFLALGIGSKLENVWADNVDVHNVRGYAHYTAAGAASGQVRNTRRTNCRAFNFNVGFETTGDVDQSYGAYNYADASAIDGGTLLPSEAIYHHYGAIKLHREFFPVARGTSAAPLLIIVTDGVDVGSVHYYEPDFDTTSASGDAPAVSCIGDTNNRLNDVRIYRGKIRGSASGALFRFGDFQIHGTEFFAANGNTIEVGGDGATTCEIHHADLEAYRPVSGSTAALGIVRGDGAQIKWYGSGKIQAFGPDGSSPYQENGVTFFGSPELYPPSATRAEPVTKKFTVPQSAWIRPNAGDPYQYAKLDMTVFRPSGVSGQAQAFISVCPLEFPFPGPPIDYSMSVLWVSNQEARVYIRSATTLTDWVLKAQVTEYPIV